MKHQSMNDSQNTVDTINGQQDNPTEIFSLYNQPPYKEEENKSNAYRTNVTGKALRFLTEIKETKY